MDEDGEILAFRDLCSPLMAALLDELALHPDVPRAFPEIEDALGWPHRRIASVLAAWLACDACSSGAAGRIASRSRGMRRRAAGSSGAT